MATTAIATAGPGRIFLRTLSCAVACIAAAAIAAPRAAAQSARPNIIFILADDLGYGELGSYGQRQILTPNLDRLAAEGLRFTSFYAGDTICAPSRGSLMTGLDTGHESVRINFVETLRRDDLTVGELLQQAGYHTALIGKWGLGDKDTPGVPEKQGFDEFLGYLDQIQAHNDYTDHLWRYDPIKRAEVRVPLPENANGKRGLYTDDLFTSAALDFVRARRPSPSNGQQPFFLYLAYTIPHANDEEAARTGDGMDVPSDAPYSSESWPQPEKNKAAMITRMDADIGQLMQELVDLGIDGETLVFFSSDNGPHSEGGVSAEFFDGAGPLRGIKRDLYEGGIRVPTIARWPGVIAPGRESDEPFAFWDFLPTAAELAGVTPPEDIDGISIVPTLLGQTQTTHHDFLYWEFYERGFQQALRMGRWKALRLHTGRPLELYDLATDIGERNDVALLHPDVIAQVEAYLKVARTRFDTAAESPDPTGSDTIPTP